MIASAAAWAFRLRDLRWPLPAVLAWVAGWALWWGLRHLGVDTVTACVAGAGAGALLAWMLPTWPRRLLAAAGFPVSALLLGAGGVPREAHLWLLAALPLAVVYPLRAWRDAPLFPTPPQALRDIGQAMQRATLAGAWLPGHVLDAGCGAGDGLLALRRALPGAALSGVECSPLLALVAAWRCRGVRVRRGDMWRMSWRGYDAVYLFQRPESMARAWAKAQAEMAPGAWLISLEFPVPGQPPTARVQADARDVWLYRIAETATAVSTSPAAGR